MAIDKTHIALQIATMAVKLNNDLVQALLELDELKQWGLDASINMNDYEGVFAGNEQLMHLDGAMLNKLLATVVPNTLNYMKTTSINSSTYFKIAQQVRRA